MQMEFERPKMSNARAIIATSLVAALAVSTTRVKQLDRDSIDRTVTSATEFLSTLPVRLGLQPAPRTIDEHFVDPRPPVEIIEAIARCETALRENYQAWKRTGSLPKTAESFANLANFEFRALATRKDVDEAAQREANMLVLSVYFLGAEMDPQSCSHLFDKFVEDLLKKATNPYEVRHIRLLQFFHSHSIWQIKDDEVLQVMHEFLQSTTDKELVIAVFATAYEELIARGRVSIATEVVREGFQAVRGHPRDFVLRNHLIDAQVKALK